MINLQKVLEINPLIFIVTKDHENCRIQLLVVVIYCKLKHNWKSDDDDAVHKLKAHKVQTVKLTLYKYKS